MKEIYDIFEQYISGQLEGDELSDFEARLKNEPELAEDLELFRTVTESMTAKFSNEEHTLALKKTLQQAGDHFFLEGTESGVEKKSVPEAKVVDMGRRRWLIRLSAVAAVLLLLFIWSPWEKSLYDQFSTHAPLALAERSNDQYDFSKAEEAFKNENFQVALEELSQYLQQNPSDLEAEYYSGICLLELNRFDEADTIFEKLHAGNSAFKEEGTWYLALSNLKQNKKEEARKYLNQISEGGDRFDAAQRLLKKL